MRKLHGLAQQSLCHHRALKSFSGKSIDSSRIGIERQGYARKRSSRDEWVVVVSGRRESRPGPSPVGTTIAERTWSTAGGARALTDRSKELVKARMFRPQRPCKRLANVWGAWLESPHGRRDSRQVFQARRPTPPPAGACGRRCTAAREPRGTFEDS